MSVIGDSIRFPLLSLSAIIEIAITDRDTPAALPKAAFDLTNTYGTFLSSHKIGKCNRISNGSASS